MLGSGKKVIFLSVVALLVKGESVGRHHVGILFLIWDGWEPTNFTLFVVFI